MAMYRVSRVVLQITLFLYLYCIAVLCYLFLPYSMYVVLVCGGLVLSKKGYVAFTAHGTARWAERDDLQKAGMLDAWEGAIIGAIEDKRKNEGVKALVALMSKQVPDKEACKRVIRCWGMQRATTSLVRIPNAVHVSIFAPAGAGKSTGMVIPNLLMCEDSCVVVDFKAEICLATADRRRRMGQEIVILDPYRVVTKNPSTLNPLDFIDKNDPEALDECRDLGEALVVRTGDEKEPHWSDSAEEVIGATAAATIHYCEGENRSLQQVVAVVSDPECLEKMTAAASMSDAWDGLLARLAGRLQHFQGTERQGVLSTTLRFLRFLNTPAIVESTVKSSFDLRMLPRKKMTIYLVLPPEHMRAQSGLLRMWVGACMRAVVKGGLQQSNKVHFILDEAAALGRMDVIDDAIDKYRGYGVRCQFYYQSMGQLKRCFKEGGDVALHDGSYDSYYARG
jgi:type IV secretion system protein VirD4